MGDDGAPRAAPRALSVAAHRGDLQELQRLVDTGENIGCAQPKNGPPACGCAHGRNRAPAAFVTPCPAASARRQPLTYRVSR